MPNTKIVAPVHPEVVVDAARVQIDDRLDAFRQAAISALNYLDAVARDTQPRTLEQTQEAVRKMARIQYHLVRAALSVEVRLSAQDDAALAAAVLDDNDLEGGT